MLLNFFQKVLALKNVPRQGWKDNLEIDNVESVAEHTYSAAIISMIYSDLHGFDTEKIIKMALLHDLSESIIGDLTPNEISKKSKQKKEDLAMKQILNELPEKISEPYYKIWNDYQESTSKEAKLLHEIDKLEMAFQAKYYQDNGYSKEKLRSFFETANIEIKSEYLRETISKFLE
jgi:putative hydrolase of HD superfamily